MAPVRPRPHGVRFSRVAALLVLVTALSGCGVEERSVAQSSPAREPSASLSPRVAFVGDSISAGLHVEAHEAYPAVLERMLAAKKLPFARIDASISGDTTASGRARIAWTLRARPRIAVVELGGNDGLRGVPVPVIERNLSEVLTRLAQADVRVLLLGVRLPDSYGTDYAAEFTRMYERLAAAHAVRFVPDFMRGVAGAPAHNMPDGLHPTAAGHVRLAQAVAGPLAELVRSATEPARAGR